MKVVVHNYFPTGDLVLWQGNYFIVKEIKDWTKFGGGMVEADCSSFQFVDAPPGTPQ